MNFKYIFFIAILFFSSCSADVRSKLEGVPAALGKTNQLVVIADDQMWDGVVGDTLAHYFSAAYPILPQPEPIFDLRHFTPEMLMDEPVRKELRTYLILGNLNDESSPTSKMIKTDLRDENVRKAKSDPKFNTTIGHDKWARGQMLIYMFGNNDDALIKTIQEKYPAIARQINQADKNQVDASTYFGGTNKKLIKDVKASFGIDLKIPHDYVTAIDDGHTMWLRKETPVLSSNILLHKLKYTDKSQFTKDGIRSIRDSLGKKYITTETENSYMRTNDQDLPMYINPMTLNDSYAVEARGIWDIVNDFMGGPFISYLIHNQSTNELIFIDGFVHAPGEKKRDFIQQLEHIIASAKF